MSSVFPWCVPVIKRPVPIETKLQGLERTRGGNQDSFTHAFMAIEDTKLLAIDPIPFPLGVVALQPIPFKEDGGNPAFLWFHTCFLKCLILSSLIVW